MSRDVKNPDPACNRGMALAANSPEAVEVGHGAWRIRLPNGALLGWYESKKEAEAAIINNPSLAWQ
jgi:hypothetical protein